MNDKLYLKKLKSEYEYSKFLRYIPSFMSVNVRAVFD